jgi:DNA-binding transcriptional ArsR family regulator
MNPGLDTVVEPLEREANLLKMLAHPTRLALLEELSQDEECVCHLSYSLDRPQPYVSKQLAELREAGLVVDRRDGNRVFYRVTDPRIATLLESARELARRPATQGRRNLAGCPCPRCE